MTIHSSATPTNFELVIPRLPTMTSLGEADQLVLKIHETVLPGVMVPVIEANWAGILARQDATHRLEFEDWVATYTVDSQFSNWKAFYDWMRYITSGKAEFATDKIVPEDHIINMVLNIRDNYERNLLQVTFYNVWIYSMGEVRLAYREGELQLESTVTFKYSYYEAVAL